VFNEQTASELTNSTGWIQQQNITEFSENSSSRTYYTNYTINVSKSGYAPSSQSENITDSTTLYITLEVANNAPTIDLINPSPNGTTDINIQPTCQIWANDTDGDTLNVTWATNESGSWVNKHTNTSITANSTVSYQFTDFDTFSKTYYWMAYADDGMENVSGWFYFATEAIDTSVDTISPYQVTSSAVSVSATGPSSLDNVTLWYRYSTDNSTWEVSIQNWWNSSWNYRKQLNITNNNQTQVLEEGFSVSFTISNGG